MDHRHLIMEKLEEVFEERFDDLDITLHDTCLWLDDICCILYEEDFISISFNIETAPDTVAIFFKTAMEVEPDIEVFECFWFDEDGEMCWPSDKPKHKFFLN